MMFIKSLSKEEQNKVKTEFLTKEASSIYRKAHRLFIISLIGLVFAVAATIFDILYKTGTWSYFLDALLFIFSAIFSYKTNDIKLKELNKYAIDNKKTKSKSKN